MEEAQKIEQLKRPEVVIDDASMAQYDQVVLFPEKLARTNQLLKTARLPERKPRQ